MDADDKSDWEAASELLPPRRASPQMELCRDAHAYGMLPELFERICNLHLWHEDSFGYVDKNIMPGTP